VDLKLKGIISIILIIRLTLISEISVDPEKYGYWVEGCESVTLFGNHPVRIKLNNVQFKITLYKN
jgi:hypothetical protein